MLGTFSATPEALDSRNRALCDMQVWPTAQKLDWRGWLRNFPAEDQHYARCLLEAFVYMSNATIDALFKAGFRSLSRSVGPFEPPADARARWHRFMSTVLVVLVEGEEPSPTDSAHLFARRARDLAHVPDSRILSPADACGQLLHGSARRPVVFVDDFVGSGNQFVDTWVRQHTSTSGAMTSLRELALAGKCEPFYVPLVATTYGLERIRYDCPQVKLYPVHELGDEYSCSNPTSLVWRPDLQAGVADFLSRSAARAGLNPTVALGFHQLALAVGFEHGVPDATLKLFTHRADGWRPLVRFDD